MSAHFDGGAEIIGRRLREVEVLYVDDPTLDLNSEDSDDCPASPPPTYYLRVREEKNRNSVLGDRGGVDVQRSDGQAKKEQGECAGESEQAGGDNSDGNNDINRSSNSNSKKNENDSDLSDEGNITDGLDRKTKKSKSAQSESKSKEAWSWRYVNVEKKSLLVWDRRGGRLLRSIFLQDVESLLVVPDEDAPGSILEVHLSSPSNGNDNRTSTGVGSGSNASEGADEEGEEQQSGGGEGEEGEGGREGEGGGMLLLQARSRKETFLWAKVLQENVELMTKRRVPLENRDEETTLSDVQQLAKLLTHQLSELQGNVNYSTSSRETPNHRGRPSDLFGADSSIAEGVEYDVNVS